MTGMIFLIVVLLLAAMALIVVELCTPTFGLLGVVALGCILWALWLCYGINQILGLVMTAVLIVGLPAYIIATVKILPKTPLGNRLHLRNRRAKPGQGTPEADKLASLVGRTTTTETTLRPSGTIRIDGQRIIAHAESGMIEKGQTVTILRAGGNFVIVRKA